jgi:hypothetical protein
VTRMELVDCSHQNYYGRPSGCPGPCHARFPVPGHLMASAIAGRAPIVKVLSAYYLAVNDL